jgi:putative transposase
LTDDLRQEVCVEISEKSEKEKSSSLRLTEVLSHLGIRTSRWYYKPIPKPEEKGTIQIPLTVDAETGAAVFRMAEENPWYGYKKIAVMCRREEIAVTDRQVYRVMKKNGLLQNRPKTKPAELHQAQKLYELLPQGPNELWQTDVTYIHIPGHGWHYAITVIDYYSRYLLACHFTWSYSASEAVTALKAAMNEAVRLLGPLKKPPFLVTDNGSSFVAKRFREYAAEEFSHVRIRYRTPTQLGLLERFHRTMKQEEVYWQEYESPGQCRECLSKFRERYNNLRPHWALVAESGGDPVTPYEVYFGGIRTQIPKWQGWAKGAKEKLEKMMEAAS